MIAEDLKRPNETTAQVSDTKLVRRLPVISELFLNPRSHSLKTLQEERVVAMASPKENLEKILFDAGEYFRVFTIQFVPNKGKNVFPCWEATTEPVVKDDEGKWGVHRRHLVTTDDGQTKLLKSAEVGFALADYSNGDDVDPVKLTFADECHA